MIRNFEMKIHDIFKFYGTCFHILKINTLDYELSLFFLFIFNKQSYDGFNYQNREGFNEI